MAQALGSVAPSALAASLPPLKLNTSVKPSRAHLMMGGASLAGLFRECPEATAMATIRTALAAGITHFDTAPHYGLGVSEERHGTAISPANQHAPPTTA